MNSSERTDGASWWNFLGSEPVHLPRSWTAEPVVGKTAPVLCLTLSLGKNLKIGFGGGGHEVFIWFHFTETNFIPCDLSMLQCCSPAWPQRGTLSICVVLEDQNFRASHSRWLSFQQKGKI
jgi:hypothetical protein